MVRSVSLKQKLPIKTKVQSLMEMVEEMASSDDQTELVRQRMRGFTLFVLQL